MSLILDRVPTGSILGRPKQRLRANAEARNELTARIHSSLLPAQREFIEDATHRILGYVGGFGSGKTFALCAKLLHMGMANPGNTLMAVEPTFPMLRTVFIPTLDACLEQWDVPYDFRVSPQPEYLLHLPTGSVKVLLQSAENWQRIRGQNIAAAVWDEADTTPADTAQKASEMLLARMRTGSFNQLAVASTPEGFRWCYRTFIENVSSEKRQITVKTRDNPNLPASFIPSLEANYPPQLIAAYLDGQYVNLASCALYPDFDRSLNYTDAKPTAEDTIFVGVDINVGNSVTQHLVRRGDGFDFFAEAVYRDTQQMASGLKELYPEHFAARRLVLIPDASAQQRSTAAAQESDVGILKKAGHTVKVQTSNPLVQDRINAVNVLIAQRRLRVGNGCKHLIRTLEQHAYDDKGRPEKGGVGMDDLSHAGDAAGYVAYRLAGIKQWKVGGSNLRVI
jgi:PBSX family phage terminase large subunit